ncbi:hypothetical protein AAHB54_04050 [Bacillus cereus]
MMQGKQQGPTEYVAENTLGEKQNSIKAQRVCENAHKDKQKKESALKMLQKEDTKQYQIIRMPKNL